MSLATDCNDEATSGLTEEAGAALWTSWGQAYVAEHVSRKMLSCQMQLGGNATFRTGFIEAAEGDGFVATPLVPLIFTNFTLAWPNGS